MYLLVQFVFQYGVVFIYSIVVAKFPYISPVFLHNQASYKKWPIFHICKQCAQKLNNQGKENNCIKPEQNEEILF